MNRFVNNYYSKIVLFGRYRDRINQHAYSTLFIQHKSIKESHHHKPFNYLSHINFVNTKSVSINESSDGFFKSFIKKVGWLPHNKTKIRLKGYLLYENVADQLDYKYWLDENKLGNNFASWFIVTELHIWMLLVRCMSDGDHGRLLMISIIDAMWSDVSVMAKKLSSWLSSVVRKQVDLLSEQFQAALVGYDEGIMSSDMVLAGAIWRRFFQSNCDDPRLIENIVRYVRKQTLHLESTELSDNPKISWIPLKEK